MLHVEILKNQYALNDLRTVGVIHRLSFCFRLLVVFGGGGGGSLASPLGKLILVERTPNKSGLNIRCSLNSIEAHCMHCISQSATPSVLLPFYNYNILWA